ncbi:MAG: hypothetical protein K8T10_13565 [Candidatus Eremiobacteraeota bacterium]|nr:hypothetical protein [Candidatus Eremiobacteraeota bacterium]
MKKQFLFRKTYLFFLALLICLMFFSAKNIEAAGNLKTVKVKGEFLGGEIGSDSCQIYIKNTAGKIIRCQIIASLDWMTSRQRDEYRKLKRTLPGRSWPTLTDTHSTVKAWCIKMSDGSLFLVKYSVLSKPVPLWITIIASTKSRNRANSIKYKAYKSGFHPDIINSSNYSKLRSGYFVVITGAFDEQHKALSAAKKAQNKGWKDAYIKRIR